MSNNQQQPSTCFLIAFVIVQLIFSFFHLPQYTYIYTHIHTYIYAALAYQRCLSICVPRICVHKGCRHVVRGMIDRCIAHHRVSTVHFSDYSQCTQWVYSYVYALLLLLLLFESQETHKYAQSKEKKKTSEEKSSNPIVIFFSSTVTNHGLESRRIGYFFLPTGYEN